MQFMEFDTSHLKGLSNFNQEQFKKNMNYLKQAIVDGRYPVVLDLHTGNNRGTNIGGFTVLKKGKLTLDETTVVFPSAGYVEQRTGQLWVYKTEFLFPATCLSLAIPKCQGKGFYYLDHTSEQEGYLLLGKLADIFLRINPLLFLGSLEEEHSSPENFERILDNTPELNPVYVFLLEALGQNLPELNIPPELIRKEVQTLTILDLAYDERTNYPVINGRTKTGIANFPEKRETYITEQIKRGLERLISLNGHQHDTTLSAKSGEDQTDIATFMLYLSKKYKLIDIEEKLQATMQLNDTAVIPPVSELAGNQTNTEGSFLRGLNSLPVTSQTKEEITGHSTPALEPLASDPPTPALEKILASEQEKPLKTLAVEYEDPLSSLETTTQQREIITQTAGPDNYNQPPKPINLTQTVQELPAIITNPWYKRILSKLFS